MDMSDTHVTEIPAHRGHGLFALPSTRLGWRAVWLFVAFAAFAVTSMALTFSGVIAQYQAVVMPFYGIAMLLVGLAGGVVGLIAIVRKRERSWLVWLATLAGLDIVFLVAGELLGPPH
jgi:hypothetical protein